MSLFSKLMAQKIPSRVEVATAIPATFATIQGKRGGIVAGIATVAVANPHEHKTELDLEAFAERAAIMEFEAGMSRAQAEFLAKCDQCRYFTRFGNCAMPQEAGLTTRFEIVQAPGEACGIFERKPPPAPY